uniref:winged helix-turn-helix domain-containing protein n=1 Tax=Streptomyces avidinii TaxID=1895 RepID=UPI003570C46B
MWRLLERHGWSWQAPARRALERDESNSGPTSSTAASPPPAWPSHHRPHPENLSSCRWHIAPQCACRAGKGAMALPRSGSAPRKPAPARTCRIARSPGHPL